MFTYKYNNLMEEKEYGRVIVKLAEIMDKRSISRNKLSQITGIKYSVIDRYYRSQDIVRVDLDLLAKICYTLECNIDDILEYKIDIE